MSKDKNLTTERSSNIHDHFPFSSERPNQTKALDRIVSWLKGPKKFFILEAPVGVGKSGMGMAAASYAKTMTPQGDYKPGAYVLSPQISLTTQYLNDFEKNGLVELKGQSNYFCASFDTDCETASLIFEDMHDRNTCTGYKPAKQQFMNRPFGVCNFDYYLAETTTAHQLEDRTLLILDEGHGCENKILGFTDTEITQKKCTEFDISERLPLFPAGNNAAVLEWLENVFIPAAQAKEYKLEEQMREAKIKGDVTTRNLLAKKLISIDKYLQRISLFTNADEPKEWFAWSDWDFNKLVGTGNLVIKPLTARLFADSILFSKAQKVLIMSGTILDFGTFMRNLGIDPNDAELLAVDSEFPLENRPIYYKPVGNMRAKDINQTLPLMAPEVGNLMTKYSKHKGIVHTQSFKTNQYFVNYLQTQGFADRILTHSGGAPKGSRQEVIDTHCASSSPTVIFSPSMTEGLDLKEDLSRFQILVKVPYPAINEYIKARMQRDPDWYTWLTSLQIIQATGRSIRSKTDKADTWILDAGFGDFLRRAKSKMPKWWRDSIVDLSKFS